MAVILPVAAGAFLVALFAGTAGDARRALLKGAVAWGVAVVSITEILSRFRGFTFVGVLIAWTVILAGLVTYLILARGIRSLRPHVLWPDHSRPAWIAVGVILLVVAVVALFAPPNNWDSMTYHMTRVEHWIQNRTVDPYPTNILRQIYPSPWAEWAIAHFQMLAGSDRFANGIQWLALAGIVAAAPLLADQLGTGSRGRWFAAILCVTMPMAILQGSSTQNDLVASFWLVASAHFALRFADGPSWREGGWAGAALGLAALTKGTGILFGIPIVILMAAAALHRVGWRALGPLAVAAVLAIGLNAGHLLRNIATFGNAAGPPAEITRHGNESHAPGAALSNVIRNAALHLATPRVSWNHKVVAGVGWLHRALGLDVDDPRTTWGGEKFHLTRKIIHEDHAPQPLHAVFFAVILLAVLLTRRLRNDSTLILWKLGLVLGWILFSFAVKWQEFHVRLQLPLFILTAPLAAAVVERLEWTRFRVVASGALVGLAALPCFFNTSRPLIADRSVLTTPRLSQYFANRPELEGPYREFVASVVDRGWVLGIAAGEDDWEYPLWVLFRRAGDDYVRLEHETGLIGHWVVVCLSPEGQARLNSTEYVEMRRVGPLSVQRRRESK